MSMRIMEQSVTEENRDIIFKKLHFSKPPTQEEIWQNRQFNKPLPDHSVDAFIWNKAEKTIDIPFYSGKQFYSPLVCYLQLSQTKTKDMSQSIKLSNNMNQALSKSKFNVTFTGTAKEEQVSMIVEAIQYLVADDAVLLQGRPGFGKTFISVYCATQIGFATLIVVNRTNLLKQWRETVLKFTTGKPWVVGEKLPTNPDGSPAKVDFVIAMIDSLNKIDESYLLKFGTLILDEAHMLMTPKQVPPILKVRPVKLILSTATPDRDPRTTALIKSFVHTNRVVRKYTGYLKVIRYETGIRVEEKMRKVGRREKLDWSDLQKQFQASAARNQKIVDWMKINIASNNTNKNIGKTPRHKGMILTWGKDHAKQLCTLLQNEGISADYFSGTKKTHVNCDVLVGTFSKMGAGYDPSSNEDWDQIHYDLLLLVGTTKSLAGTEQYIGRVFRSEKPHVVIFIDSHDNCESHYKEMMKVIELYEPKFMCLNTVVEI